MNCAKVSEQLKKFSLNVENIFADKGYRGHGIIDKCVHICSGSKKKKGRSLWCKVKRRAAIEPIIGHLKSDSCLDKNKLSGTDEDAFNLLLSCAAYTLRKILKRLKSLIVYLFALILFMLPSPRRAVTVA